MTKRPWSATPSPEDAERPGDVGRERSTTRHARARHDDAPGPTPTPADPRGDRTRPLPGAQAAQPADGPVLVVAARARARRVALAVSGTLIGLGGLAVAGLTSLVVWTHLGQRADERSRWSVAVPFEVRDLLVAWLDTVSVVSIALALLVIAGVALLRRRPVAALGALILVAGANVTTQVLKELIPRPAYGVGPAMNSLPSGHTTVMTSLVLALLLVVPRGLRPLLVCLTSAVATFTGAATILERWHRPSDVIAAFGVCAVWAGLVLGFVALRRRGDPATAARPPAAVRPPRLAARAAVHAAAGMVGAVAIGALLVVGGLVAHGEASNVLVGGVMLTATGLTGALLAALTGLAADALDAS